MDGSQGLLEAKPWGQMPDLVHLKLLWPLASHPLPQFQMHLLVFPA